MKSRISRKRAYRAATLPLLLVGLFTASLWIVAEDTLTQIDATNWGWVTAPVYGTSEGTPYEKAVSRCTQIADFVGDGDFL